MTEIPLPEALEVLSDYDLAMFTDMVRTGLADPATSPGERERLAYLLNDLYLEEQFREELAEQDLLDTDTQEV